MNGLKRRLRSHFWFPKMDSKIESKIEGCAHCKMFTNKTTHEPTMPHQTSDKAWTDVSVDLFGPMPDNHHVVAVIDKTSRFPAAKVVPNTTNKAVTNALSQIYSDYGQPSSHQTDNGPPFNSEGFTKFSADNGIKHIKTHPYHPAGNPVENFMRPVGKCRKAAHHQRANKTHALNNMLASYRATPHPATGIAPGNIMFRSGYKKDFPRCSASETEVKEALESDRNTREARGQLTNTSNHSVHLDLMPNQMVIVRNINRKKFDPIFGPQLHKVIDVKGNGATLLRVWDSKIVRRHLNDIKDASSMQCEADDTCWTEGDFTPNYPPLVAQNPNPLPPIDPTILQAPTPTAAAEAPAGEPSSRPQRSRRPPVFYSDENWAMERRGDGMVNEQVE